MDYNTQRAHLKLREYGRNVQNLVAHLRTIEDQEEKNKKAATLVELMKLINPDLSKDSIEHDQKIWDDLHLISNYELEVEGPFPKPDAEAINRKPEKVAYCSNDIKYRHYGRSVEILIEQACAMEDPKEREGAIVAIGRLMKSFFQAWNKEQIEDEQVLKNIRHLSNDQLTIDIELVKELGLFDSDKKSSGGGRSNNYRNKGRRPNNANNNKGGGRRNQQNKRRRS